MTTILIENISKSFETNVTPKESTKKETNTSVFHSGKALFDTVCARKSDEPEFLFGDNNTFKRYTAHLAFQLKAKLFQSFVSKSYFVGAKLRQKLSFCKERSSLLERSSTETVTEFQRFESQSYDSEQNQAYTVLQETQGKVDLQQSNRSTLPHSSTSAKQKLFFIPPSTTIPALERGTPNRSFKQKNGSIPHKVEDALPQKNTKRVQGTQALREVYLEVPKGAITALVGGSGSGKSTLLRIIAGLDKPDQGSIWLNGKNTSCMSVQERGIGFVSQSYALFPHMTVLDNIAFGLRVKKELPLQIETKCQYLLKLIQLSNLASYYPSQLSGGQKQRVALARALAPDPKFLLLDEPFAALDMRMRKELREWLYTLQKQSSVTIVLVTHDYKEALEIATNIVMLKNGRVEQLGHPVDFYDYFLQNKLL